MRGSINEATTVDEVRFALISTLAIVVAIGGWIAVVRGWRPEPRQFALVGLLVAGFLSSSSLCWNWHPSQFAHFSQQL